VARKGLLLITLLLVTLTSSFALSPVLMDSEVIDAEISSNEAATFKITLMNNQNHRDTLRLSAPQSKWDVTFSDHFVEVPAKGQREISVRLAPPITINEGKYAVFLKVASTENPDVTNHEYVHVSVTKVHEETREIREISVSENVQEGMFGKSYSFDITNTGNVLYSDEWTDIFSSFDIAILTSNLEYTTIPYGTDTKVSWAIDLEPGETMNVSYSVSYYPVLIGGLLLLLAVFLFITNYLNKFSVVKELRQGAGTILVNISIKNRTNTEMKNVKVEDLIPKPLNLVEDFSTLIPNSLVNTKNGTKVAWKFDTLAPKEEIIITYQVKSSMHVIGNLQLPQAKLTQGKTTVFSGNVKLIGK